MEGYSSCRAVCQHTATTVTLTGPALRQSSIFFFIVVKPLFQMHDCDLRVNSETFTDTLYSSLLNRSDVPMLTAGSSSSAVMNTATHHTHSPQAHPLQDQAHHKQAVLRRCSAEGTQASSSSTARIPSATHTAALMLHGHLAAPPGRPTSTAHLPRPVMCSCPTLLGHTQTAGDSADPKKPGSAVPPGKRGVRCAGQLNLPQDDQ